MVVEARRLIVGLERERWRRITKDLASALEKSVDTVTSIQRGYSDSSRKTTD
jgi:hypothetical protein